MNDRFFQNYSEEHVHFYHDECPALLELGLALISDVEKPYMVDLGCGDGRLLYALHKKGLLSNFGEIVGVDVSAKRIERLKKEMPFVSGVVSNASSVRELPSSSFDYVICSQVIEHVQDDIALVVEINRLMKVGGVAYVSSVVKHRYGAYFYPSNGSLRLDPTHIREYSSENEFLSLFQNRKFELVDSETHQVMRSFLNLLLRLFIKFDFMEPDPGFFRKHGVLARKIKKVGFPVLGYKTVEVLLRKIE